MSFAFPFNSWVVCSCSSVRASWGVPGEAPNHRMVVGLGGRCAPGRCRQAAQGCSPPWGQEGPTVGGLLRDRGWLLQRILAAWTRGGESTSQKWDQRAREARAASSHSPPCWMSGFPTPPQPFPRGLVHSRGDHYLPCPTAREVPLEHGLCNPACPAVCDAQALPALTLLPSAQQARGPLLLQAPGSPPILSQQASHAASGSLSLPCRDCPGPGSRWERN